MKISNEQNIEKGKELPQSPKEVVNIKTFGQLSTGDKFKATVVDIHPTQVTLSLLSGETLTAKSLILPDARIGDESIFVVKENFKGQILLEMLKPEDNHIQNNIIKEALSTAGLYPTEENINIVQQLMSNNLPLNKETLQKATFFNYSADNMSIDKVLFLLKENFPMTQKSVNILNDIISKNLRLDATISDIIDEIIKLDDTILKKQIINLISNYRTNNKEISNNEIKTPNNNITISNFNNEKSILITNLLEKLSNSENEKNKEQLINQVKNILNEKLFIDITKDDSYKHFKDYYKNLQLIFDEVSQKVSQSALHNNNLQNQINNLKDALSFMNHIDSFKEYMQIPFSISNNQNQGELFIFKDSKKSKNLKEQATVLISLDNVNMGHVEVFINKIYSNISLQFKVENEKIIKLININKEKLELLLREKGYTVSGFSLKKLEEHFSVCDNIEKNDMNEKAENKSIQKRRYSFDMRV